MPAREKLYLAEEPFSFESSSFLAFIIIYKIPVVPGIV